MKFTIHRHDKSDEFDTDSNNTTPARTSSGRFPKGNKEGNRFLKGHAGKPKGARNRKTLVAREFAHDVLYLDPDTGRQMNYHDLCIWIKKKSDTSPRILNLLLDHALGKPPEQIQQEWCSIYTAARIPRLRMQRW